MIYAILVTPAEVAQGGVFKYVRLADDSLRFANIDTQPEHCQMVDENDPTPKSAGSIVVRSDRSVMTINHGSMTLKLPSADDDEEVICKAIFGQ